MDFDIPELPVRQNTGVNFPAMRDSTGVNLNKSLRNDISMTSFAVKQFSRDAKETGVHVPAKQMGGLSGVGKQMGRFAKQSIGPSKQSGETDKQMAGLGKQSGGLSKQLSVPAKQLNGPGKHPSGPTKQLNGPAKHPSGPPKQLNGSAKQPSGPANHPSAMVKQPNGPVKQMGGSAIQSGGSSKQLGGLVKQSSGPAKHVQRPKSNQPSHENKAEVIPPKMLNKSINDIEEVPVRNEKRRPRRSATMAVNYNDDIDEKEFNKRAKPSTSDSGLKNEVDLLNRGKKRKSMDNNSVFNKVEKEVNSSSKSKLDSSLDNYLQNDKNKRSRIAPTEANPAKAPENDIPIVRNRNPTSRSSQLDKRPLSSSVGNRPSPQAPNDSIPVSRIAPGGTRAKNASVAASAKITPIVTNAKISSVASNVRKASVANISKIAAPAKNSKVSLPASNSKVAILPTNSKIVPSVPDSNTRKANNDIPKRAIPYLKRQINIRLVPNADPTEICYPWPWHRYPGISRRGTWRNYPVSAPEGRKHPGTGRRGREGQIKMFENRKFESSRHPENLSDGVIWFWRDAKIEDPYISKEYADNFETQQIEFTAEKLETCRKSQNSITERLEVTDHPQQLKLNFNTEDQNVVEQKSSEMIQIDTKTDFMPSFNNNPDLSWEEAIHKCNECNIKYIIKCHLLAHNRRVHEKKPLENIDKNLPVDKETILSVKPAADMNVTPTQFASDKKELQSRDDLESDGDESDSDVTSGEDEIGSDEDMEKEYDDGSDEDMEKEDDYISDEEDSEMDKESDEVYCVNCDTEYDPAGDEDHSQCSLAVNP